MNTSEVYNGSREHEFIDVLRESVLFLDHAFRVVLANRAFYRLFKTSPAETERRSIFELENGQWDIPTLRRALVTLRHEPFMFQDLEIRWQCAHAGEKVMQLNGRRLSSAPASAVRYMLAIEDTTASDISVERDRHSKSRYHKLVDELNSIIISFDSRGAITFFNPFAEKIFGYHRREVLGKPFVGTILPPVDSFGTDNTHISTDIFQSPEKFYANESEGVRKNGERVWFTWSAKAVRDETGAVTEILIDGNDITELATLRVEMEQKNATLDATIDAIPDGFVIYNRDGSIRRINTIAQQVLGYTDTEKATPHESLVRSLHACASNGEGIPVGQFPSLRAFRGDIVRNEVMKICARSREYWLSVSASPITVAGHGMVGVVMEFSDITGVQQLQQQLTKERNFVDIVLETSGALIAVLTPEGRFVRFNKACEQLSGYAAPEVIGKSLFDLLIAPEERAEVELVAARLRAGESGIEHEHHWVSKSGRRYYIRWRYTIVLDERGVMAFYVKSGLDITDRQELQEQLGHRAEELAVANAELESFSISVSHDLRNPLGNIVVMTDLLTRRAAHRLDEKGRRALDEIERNTTRMTHTITDLLHLARIARGELAVAETDLSALARITVDQLRNNDPSRDVDVSIQPHMRSPVDSGLIHLALDNLIGNAWKFTANRDKAVIEVGMEKHPERVVFFVRDNGEGFDMRDAHRIFAPFQRAHTDAAFSGSGVGLSIVQRVIQKHGGEVWAVAEKGRGACFFFSLPSTR